MSTISILTTILSLLSIASAVPFTPSSTDLFLHDFSKRALTCPSSDKTYYTSGTKVFYIGCNVNYAGNDMPSPNGQAAGSLDACMDICAKRSGCVGATWPLNTKKCWLKKSLSTATTKTDVWAGKLQSTSYVQGKGKRGLAYNNGAWTKYFAIAGQASKVSWMVNWYSKSTTADFTAAAHSKLDFVPMLWSNASDLTSVIATNAASAKNVLAFNEPDQCGGGGSCLGTPQQAASYYKKYMQPLSTSTRRLGSPAVTNSLSSSAGLAYLADFLTACSSCTVDFVAIHWYGDASDVSGFKQHVQNAYSVGGGRKVWITEFGCASGTVAQTKDFMRSVLPWLDAQGFVERYAYFGVFNQYQDNWDLISSDGSKLTELGVLYNTM
ncbi:glycoside hydrolase family 128 protein [Aulographum hederae CBS 113979]|uniref:Glycoside hydrolase family 128 protein n=1 Tax=Aulographum hederae CBS 113979 TaxID=1176131 RepID=A0A6G1HGY1_9PEZI|nr:glycoside hydrolase family 128 protein [Aulographum hederae CBS 113979]